MYPTNSWAWSRWLFMTTGPIHDHDTALYPWNEMRWAKGPWRPHYSAPFPDTEDPEREVGRLGGARLQGSKR